MNNAVNVLKFSVTSSPSGDRLVGTDGHMYLGETPVLGTFTATLREFNLPTTRAPGDWPYGKVTDTGTVRY